MVGFQFQHTALQGLFENITFSCDGLQNCHNHCGDDNWDCYLIDNNGFIIAAENKIEAGRFFGEVKAQVMTNLVEEGIFDKIRVFDYQAVCFKSTQLSNHANILLTVGINDDTTPIVRRN